MMIHAFFRSQHIPQFFFVMPKISANISCMAHCVQTEDEKEMVSRTVYCTNIDKKVWKPIFLAVHDCMWFQTCVLNYK